MAVTLGSTVKDMITGFEGIVMSRAEYAYGCVRIMVEAKGMKDGKPLEPMWMDEQRAKVLLEIEDKGMSLSTPCGNVVRDTVTGFEGIVIGEIEHLYGRPQVLVQPQVLHEGKMVEACWIYEQRVEVIRQDKRGAEDTEKAMPRFTRDAATGVIRDPETCLEWLVGPDVDTDYAAAELWVASLGDVSGGGWRMPTIAELKTLYQWGVGDRNMDPVFGTTGWFVWGEPRDESSAWRFDFLDGGEYWYYRDGSSNYRVFAARSRR